jgi:hypothetical protein
MVVVRLEQLVRLNNTISSLENRIHDLPAFSIVPQLGNRVLKQEWLIKYKEKVVPVLN